MIRELLMIDDDPVTLKMLKMTITRHRFAKSVNTLLNGQEGIDYFEMLISGEEHTVPDLVFLDINMPVMNGWEFLDEYSQRFKEHFPNTWICMLSSSVNPRDQEKALSYSRVITFISKPIFIEEMNMLRNHQSLKHFFDNGLN